MIARDSKSYPYLAIAQHYDIPYGEVLFYSEMYKRFECSKPISDWKLEVWKLEKGIK